MTAPSWVELVGRNVAAEAMYVSGEMRVTGNKGDRVLSERFRFWHGPNGRWRIESDDEVVYISSAGGDAIVRVDGEMQRQRGDFGTVHLGPAFSPLDLMGLDSMLRRMSARMEPSVAQQATVGGRAAWSVTLTSPSGDSALLTFDSITGVLVHMAGPKESSLLEVFDALERPHDVLRAIAAADSGQAARDAVIQLLGVSPIGAEAVTTMQLMGFRSDVARQLRAELARLQGDAAD
ncbi:hypothetical protein [Rhodococcus sp. 24CO]|uniref:hypothetical protein n=1 Tax=Rhodococcus sp. 24CO TaxID=3117460 RepID=UPI003D337013